MAVTTIDGVKTLQIRKAKNGDFDLNLAGGGGSGGDSQGLYYEFITTYDAQDEATQTIVPGKVKPNQPPFNFGATNKRIYDGPSKVLLTYNYETDPAGNSTDLKKYLLQVVAEHLSETIMKCLQKSFLRTVKLLEQKGFSILFFISLLTDRLQFQPTK